MRDQQMAIHLKLAKMNKKYKWWIYTLFIILLLAIGVAGWKTAQLQLLVKSQQHKQEKSNRHIQLLLKDLNHKNQFLLQQKETIDKQIIQLAKDQQKKWQQYFEQNSTILHKIGELDLRQNKMDDIQAKEINKLQNLVRMIERIGNHPENSHKQFYSVTLNSAKSAKISKTGYVGYHNFVNKLPIYPQIRQTGYKVKLSKLQYSVLIGFTTSKGFGVIDNYRSAESVYYDNYKSGYLYEQGKWKQLAGAGAAVGDTIEVVVDFATGRFEWLKNGTKLVECSIPASMKQKPIYLSMSTKYIGNEVEVFA